MKNLVDNLVMSPYMTNLRQQRNWSYIMTKNELTSAELLANMIWPIIWISLRYMTKKSGSWPIVWPKYDQYYDHNITNDIYNQVTTNVYIRPNIWPILVNSTNDMTNSASLFNNPSFDQDYDQLSEEYNQ